MINPPLSIRHDDFRGDRDVLRIPVIRVAYALSLLLHAAVLWPWLPPQRPLTPGEVERKEAASRLQVRIEPRAIPVPPAAAPARPAPRPLRAPAPAPAPRQPPSIPAPVIAQETPRATIPPPAPPAPIARVPAPVRAPVIADMAALIEARRRARGEPAPPAPPLAEDENARSDRIVAENLGSKRAPTFGEERRNSGGIFQIEHVYFDSADFLFYGWNRDIRRNTRQVIEVRKGNNSDIRIAIVRRMIAIIREYEQEDFRWDSPVLRRTVILSARQSDSAGLEEFLMREFFPEYARTR